MIGRGKFGIIGFGGEVMLYNICIYNVFAFYQKQKPITRSVKL